MTDEQLIQRLRNASTDAVLSGDHVRALWLAQAAARLTELSIIHHTWHPSFEEVANTPNEDFENLAILVKKLMRHEPRFAMAGNGYEIAMRLDGIYFKRDEALEMYAYFADIVREIKLLTGCEVR